MKEIKAYVHSTRIADVIAALKACPSWSAAHANRRHNMAVYVVKGSLMALDQNEKHFSIDLGDEVVNEYKLELQCDDHEAEEIVTALRATARTGQAVAGWITVTDLAKCIAIH